MQLPKRRGQQNAIEMPDVYHVTAAGKKRMEAELIDLKERQLPQALESMRQALELGDFSENAEYQDAKPRLARLNTRLFLLTERLKRAHVIGDDAPTGTITLGSTVLLFVNGKQKTYQIVAPQESSPARGRISHVSPLGSALLGRTAGETVTLKTENGEMSYDIVEIR